MRSKKGKMHQIAFNWASIYVNGSTTLTFDYDNINTIPWPPITPGKENCINPVTTKSGCVV